MVFTAGTSPEESPGLTARVAIERVLAAVAGPEGSKR